jgi:hypothetical protein
MTTGQVFAPRIMHIDQITILHMACYLPDGA